MALRLLLKLPPGVATPKRYYRHKSHVPQTQFLCALGRPREGFDGKVGCWRVTKSRPALRNKHVGPNAGRKVGDAIIEDATLDAAKYVEMMTKLVFPAIRKAYAGEEVVIVQHDGAPGHTHREAGRPLARTHRGWEKARGAHAQEGARPQRRSPRGRLSGSYGRVFPPCRALFGA